MAKKSSNSKRSSHQGYGMPNIARFRFPKKQLQDITSKKWEDVTNLDLYILVQKKWTIEKIQRKFNTNLTSVLNRLRY